MNRLQHLQSLRVLYASAGLVNAAAALSGRPLTMAIVLGVDALIWVACTLELSRDIRQEREEERAKGATMKR